MKAIFLDSSGSSLALCKEIKNKRIFLSRLIFCFAFLFPLHLHAQEEKAEEAPKFVTVRLRLVKATQDIDKNKRTILGVDSRLRDLAEKLKMLPFKKFSLISEYTRKVEFLSKGGVNMDGDQKVVFRPLAINPKTIALWLKWKNGEETVLDTRVHVKKGHTLLAGTDSSSSTGMVLAVDVTSD